MVREIPRVIVNFHKLYRDHRNFWGEAFFQVIYQFLSKYFSTGHKDWSTLLPAVELFEHRPSNTREESEDFYNFIFNLFEELRCNEYLIIILFLHSYVSRHVLPPVGLLLDFGVRRSVEINSRMILREQSLHHFKATLVKPIFLDYYKATKTLLRFGLPFYWEYVRSDSYYVMYVVSRVWGYTRRPLMDKGDFCRVLASLRRMVDSKSPRYSERRMILMMVATDAIIQPNTEDSDSVKSYRLVYKTIRDPFLTTTEISKFLGAILIKGDDREETIASLCQEFEKILPRAGQPSQPRSLKQLSRCAVRNILNETNKLPFGVSDLDIPPTLRQYLLFE